MRRLLVVLVLCAPPVFAQSGLFSAGGLDGWTEQTFEGKKPTRYRLVRDSGVQVLEADCQGSASGWIWKQKIDLERTPVLRWRWKVARVYSDVREREKKGDDFPARVYVVLGSGRALSRTRSVVYVWASSHEERRDVRADFRRYFGIDVSAADGVAIMTDCDDAGGTTRAWYGDVRFGPSG